MRRLFLVCMLAVAAGCPSDPPPECKTEVDTSCAPGYVPTFENVYNNQLKEGCGSTKSNCHSARNRAGDLSFESMSVAYDGLLDPTKTRVIPGNPMCSEMIVRTDSPGEDYQMPPGDALTGPQRCALIQWVVQGALP